MRKCLRCGSEMKEGCAIKVEGAGYGIVLSDDATKLFSGRIGKPNVAICPSAERCPSTWRTWTSSKSPRLRSSRQARGRSGSRRRALHGGDSL